MCVSLQSWAAAMNSLWRKTVRRKRLNLGYCLMIALMLSAIPQIARSQGSIFGQVKNVDLSTPADNQLIFFGFLDNTDEEVRVEASVGAGYESGNWYDDFQNYLTEAAGNPYRYYFSNIQLQQGHILSSSIPSNSFQQENINLSAVSWPLRPTGLNASYDTSGVVTVHWNAVIGLTYHVYRRVTGAGGSLFRIDNPTGDLGDRGIDGNTLIDSSASIDTSYDYMIIGENDGGDYSPHSAIKTAQPQSGCCTTAGDASGDEKVNIADVTQLIRLIFFFEPLSVCNDQGDANGDNSVNIGDITYIINWMFRGGPGPVCGNTGS